MTDAPHPIVNLSDLRLDWLSKGSRFQVGLGDIGRPLGLNGLGATMHVVPAHKTAWPFHRHYAKDELFLILEGEGELRFGDRRLPIRAGDCIGCPAAGEAHQLINNSDNELRYIAFSNRSQAEVIEYPDSGRVSVDIARGLQRPADEFNLSGKFSPFGYWDGEDVDGSS